MNKKGLLKRIARTAGWIFAGIMVCAGMCLHASLHAQSPSARDPKTTVKKEAKTNAKTNAKKGAKQDAKKTALPPGFYRGATYINFFGGRALAPSGSLIEHEKTYDRTVRRGIESGAYGSRTLFQPGFAIHSYYTGGGSGQVELEYGTWPNIGMGISLLHFSIQGNRQDVFMFPAGALPSGNYLYEPAPRNRDLYQGTSLMYLLTWHPRAKRALDPYLAFRAGVTGFTGHAHAGLTPDPNRYSSKIRNGVGGILGAGVGLNWFFNEAAGLKLEATYYRQVLKADQFQRSLGSVHLQAGYVLNFEGLQRLQ